MDILLTFTGFHDPYSKGLVGDEEQPGPILTILQSRKFERIFIFDTPATQKNTEETKAAVEKVYKKAEVRVIKLNLSDPTNYKEILKGLKYHIPEIVEEFSDARLFISVSSGTPHMHACWFMLAASGEIPARILNSRPPKFVTREQPIVTEIDFSSNEFPSVRFLNNITQIDEEEPNFNTVIERIGIIGEHPKMIKCLNEAAKLASSTSPILIFGETGTGKDLIAKFIHHFSERNNAPFIVINCGAIPENLVESSLFGHKKGSFSGAINDQKGKFTLADKGTLFLDELGELPPAAQSKLLRVLQDKVVEPIGEAKGYKVDVRVICATNKDLRKMVKQGKFREDLFYRLNVGEIKLPALRERRTDITKLALFILDKLNASLKSPKRLSAQALKRLQAHNWLGNVRELENVLERSARLCQNEILEADDLTIDEPVSCADPLESLPEPYEGFQMESFLSSARKQLILKAIEAAKGNMSQAARMLGVSPQAIHKFIQQSKDKN